MNPLLKKVIAALAIKEGFEKVQEMRNPKPSLGQRLGGSLKFLGLGGGLFLLYKTGRLTPLVDKAKGLMGGSDSSVSSEHTWSAPAATNGSTTSGTVSTPSSI